MKARDKRIRPGLDDKSLTSWNALMLKGYVDAYMAFEDKNHLDIALKNANFIADIQLNNDGKLWHSYKNGKSTINGYLEDYSLTISAFIRLYEVTFDEKWLHLSDKMMQYAITHFYDTESSMFFFTSDLDPKLVARKMEINDNVIPASNSVIANSLFDLGIILDNNNYQKMAITMLNNVKPKMSSYATGYANYATLFIKVVQPYFEVAIVGDDANKTALDFNKLYAPNKITLGSTKQSSLPLLQNKFINGETIIYVCEDKVCQLPTSNIIEAQKLLK